MAMTELSLTDKLLIASADVASGDIDHTFNAEELVVAAWRHDPRAFGLRGHETQFPDSNKVYTKIDGRNGLVTKGLLAKAGERKLRLTEAGLARAARFKGNASGDLQGKLERTIQSGINRILSHPVFTAWLADRTKPDRFRGAGHFWGIAPGTPATTVRSRVVAVDSVLNEALTLMTELGLTEVVEQRGRTLFERKDVELAREFQNSLKDRFRGDLKILDPKGSY